jgi:hypothetical protein
MPTVVGEVALLPSVLRSVGMSNYRDPSDKPPKPKATRWWLAVVAMTLSFASSSCGTEVSDGTKVGQITCRAHQALVAGNYLDFSAIGDSASEYKAKYAMMSINARQMPEYDQYVADVRAVVTNCISDPKDREEAALLIAGVSLD